MEESTNNIFIKKVDKNSNFRKSEFEIDFTKYELGISIYSNSIFIIITYNGKLGSFYYLDREEINPYNDDFYNEDDTPSIEMTDCLLGDRNNEKWQFISNYLLTFISKNLKNDKIKKIVLSLTLKEDSNKPFEINENSRNLIEKLKDEIKKILTI